MAGQPKRRAMREMLETLTREYFEDDPVPTVLNYVTCRLEDGSTIADIAADISARLNLDIPREWVSAYVHSFDEAAERVRTARARASHSWAERAVGAVNAPASDSVDVARANNQSRVYLRMAEACEVGSYAQSKGVNVAISVTQLHLAALQQYGTTVTGSPQLEPQTSASTSALPLQVEAQQRVS
jgi:hypothetical protein